MNATSNDRPTRAPSDGGAMAGDCSGTGATPSALTADGVQGEGFCTAAREFNLLWRRSVASGRLAAAARAAAPTSEAERQAIYVAELKDRQCAMGADPRPPKSMPWRSTLTLPRKDVHPKR